MPFLQVCVFCSASENLEPHYQDLARNLGRMAESQPWAFVYGGGSRGLMGIVADTALSVGAEVTGVIPEALVQKEIAHRGLTHLEICEDMHARQKRMAELADVFVVLPGGLGTMAEFLEVLTWKQLGFYDKPIALINDHQYWDGLVFQIESAKKSDFLHTNGDLFTVFSSLEPLPAFFTAACKGE